MLACWVSHDNAVTTFGVRVRSTCTSTLYGEYYFQDRMFSTSEDDGVADRGQYSRVLRDLHEPSLSCGPTPDEAYRVVWISPFEPDPVGIRVSRTGERFELVATALRGPDENYRLVTVKRTEKALTRTQWQTLTSALSEANVWLMPFQPLKRVFVLDGADWLFEARSETKYHVVPRHSGDETGPFKTVLRLLFTLAGFPVPEELEPAVER